MTALRLNNGPLDGKIIFMADESIKFGQKVKVPDAEIEVTHVYLIDRLGRAFYEHSTDKWRKKKYMADMTEPLIPKEMIEAATVPLDVEPKLTMHYRITGLPQSFSEREVIDHVATLLRLGAANVSVYRVVRDEATGEGAADFTGRY